MSTYKIIQQQNQKSMLRCKECDKTISWEEATDMKWTTKGFEYDGLCYSDKKRLMRKKALDIIEEN